MADRSRGDTVTEKDLLPYVDFFSKDLLTFGTALDKFSVAQGIVNDSTQAVRMKILSTWKDGTAGATWTMLYEKLVDSFKNTADKIQSDHKDSMNGEVEERELLPYLDDLASAPLRLGAAVGFPKAAEAIVNQVHAGSKSENCLKILSAYLASTANCTWSKFFDQIESTGMYKGVVDQIKADIKIADIN